MREGRQWPWWRQQISRYWLNVKVVLSWLTVQFELLLLNNRALVWEILCNQVLQVCRAAWFWLGWGQNICNCLLLLLQNKTDFLYQQDTELVIYAKITICNSRCHYWVHTLTFLFLLGFSDFSSSVSFFWGVITSFCVHIYMQKKTKHYKTQNRKYCIKYILKK